ncbi:helix-turn-helix domain-containing protein [Marinobacter lipolyticus]|uniref:AraC family transcriptional regulator n=1 Tax=Marinobacter lipolyticus TaxID=209639 RepID=UPI003A8E4881
MTITVPDHLFENATPFAHFRTEHLEIIRYQHRKQEVVNEVVLNKSLLLFVNKGGKRLKVSDEEAILSDHQGAFIPKGSYIMTEVADHQCPNGFESLMVLIEDEFLGSFFSNQAIRLPIPEREPRPEPSMLKPWVSFEKTPFLDTSMLSLRAFFDYPERVNSLFLEEKVREILFYLLDTSCCHQLLSHMKFTSAGGRNARLRQFLESHYMQPWSVEQFAEKFGLSVSTFKRECNSSLGMSPKRWINKRRLKSARQRLLCGHESLTDIAMELGFVDGSHFSRMFRKEFKSSPSAYRNKRAYEKDAR